jgi:hypothetical protein
MSRTRIHNLAISLDGFATREPQSTEAPFGHAGQRLHDWMFGTRFWARQGAPGGAADAGGSAGGDHAFAERHGIGFGAEIMGANKFGPGLAGRSGLEGLVGAVTVFNAAGASWDWASFYGLSIGIEVLLLAFILRAAWTWPRAAVSSMSDRVEPNRSPIQMGR